MDPDLQCPSCVILRAAAGERSHELICGDECKHTQMYKDTPKCRTLKQPWWQIALGIGGMHIYYFLTYRTNRLKEPYFIQKCGFSLHFFCWQLKRRLRSSSCPCKLSMTGLQGGLGTSWPNPSKVCFSEHYLSRDIKSYFKMCTNKFEQHRVK